MSVIRQSDGPFTQTTDYLPITAMIVPVSQHYIRLFLRFGRILGIYSRTAATPRSR